ncbi:MAG: hypothetical protein U0412_06155 [Nitrospira sp.]
MRYCLHRRPVGWLFSLTFLLATVIPASAENAAPSVHWGAIAFPDRDPTLQAGLTINRFTEFNPSRSRFNAVNDTAGFNFATISWTERIAALPGWNGNLTIGTGPTAETPSREIQNNFVHRAIGNGPVPADSTRQAVDGMVGGSLTRWLPLFSSRDTGFVGLGLDGGSLYQELYGRIGLRQFSVGEFASWLLPDTDLSWLHNASRFVRFSAMGRYSRIFGGSAYSSDVLTPQSYLGQVSVSFGDFVRTDGPLAGWEVEVALSYDSGLFASQDGRWILRRFGSVALRFPYGSLETWNDWVGSTDSGPTYGVSLMLNVRKLASLFSGS